MAKDIATSLNITAPDNKPIGELTVEEISRLIELIYEGPLEPLPWTKILRWLNQNLNANWATLMLRPASKELPSLIIQAHYQEVTVSSADYILFNIYSTDPFTDLPLDHIMTPEEFLGKEQWLRNDFFSSYLNSHNAHHQIGADFRSDDCSICRLRVCRTESAGPFTPAERSLCQLLLPHFKRAVFLHSRLYTFEVEKKLYAATFERLHIGTVILDEQGAPLSSNAAAEEIFSARNAIWLSKNIFHTQSKGPEKKLHAAIEQALAVQSDEPIIIALSVPRTASSNDLKVLVKSIPLSARVEGSHRPAVGIFIHDPEFKQSPPVDVLRMLFNFTPAEASFAKLLTEGYSLDEAGERLGISKNTVKSRLRSIFAKTGTARQSSLMRVLLDTMVSL